MNEISGRASRRGRTIAIDGPSGSGKSTTARILAARLGYQFLDTGAMYRVVTVIAKRRSIAPSDGKGLAALASELEISFKSDGDLNRVFVDGEEVTTEIRTPEVTREVSEVSAHIGVREAMVKIQQELGRHGGVVAEGRDTTTVVFPDADLKIYLQAPLAKRAARRLNDMEASGISSSEQEQAADLERRDRYDSGREHSPLMKAHDAHVVDTGDCTIEEQVQKILSLLDSVPE